MKAIILKADGTPPYVDDIEANLDGISEVLEGYMEAVPSVNEEIAPKINVYANEEGMILNLPWNRNIIAIRQLGLPQPLYAGNLIVFGPVDEHGDETPALQEIIDLIVPPTEMPEGSETPPAQMVDYLSLMGSDPAVEDAQRSVNEFRSGLRHEEA